MAIISADTTYVVDTYAGEMEFVVEAIPAGIEVGVGYLVPGTAKNACNPNVVWYPTITVTETGTLRIQFECGEGSPHGPRLVARHRVIASSPDAQSEVGVKRIALFPGECSGVSVFVEVTR
jgi:hypothetical protein